MRSQCLISPAMGHDEDRASRRLYRNARPDRPVAVLLPIMGVVLVAFLVIGIAMPVLPLHVHDGLSLGTSWLASLPAVSSRCR